MRVDFVSNDLKTHFDILENVGEGSYGVVTKCKRKSNGQIVAIKFIKKYDDNEYERKTDKKGLRIDIYREIQILNCLYDNDPDSCVNYDYTNNRITKLNQILIGTMQKGKYNLALIFDYYEFTLSQIIRYHRKKLNATLFSNAFIAKILYQILEGLDVLHSHWIIHRDLKPSNILIDVKSGGIIKLCDFGLSKIFQKYQTKGMHRQQKDGEIVTLYYRSPELFLTKKNTYHQSPAIDIWSIGCIFSELMTLKALFKIDILKVKDHSRRNYELMKNICYIIGYPHSVKHKNKANSNHHEEDEDVDMNEDDLSKNTQWNGVENLCYYKNFIEHWKSKYNYNKGCLFERKVKSATSVQKDLLKKLLMMDPSNRLKVKQAIKHPYFDFLFESSGDKEQSLLIFPDGTSLKYI